jgi:hypothetical protein
MFDLPESLPDAVRQYMTTMILQALPTEPWHTPEDIEAMRTAAFAIVAALAPRDAIEAMRVTTATLMHFTAMSIALRARTEVADERIARSMMRTSVSMSKHAVSTVRDLLHQRAMTPLPRAPRLAEPAIDVESQTLHQMMAALRESIETQCVPPAEPAPASTLAPAPAPTLPPTLAPVAAEPEAEPDRGVVVPLFPNAAGPVTIH